MSILFRLVSDRIYCCSILVEFNSSALKNVSMTPVIEVSHLPSSASFYAAVCQPLGIHFIPQPSYSSSLDFGLPASPAGPCDILFTLTTNSQPQISLLKFRASSQAAVTEFHWRALQANYNSIVSTNLIKNTPDESIARITDLDGNMLEARFIRRSSTSVLTSAPPKETRRVLDWQRDVAKSLSGEENMSASHSTRQSTPLVRSSSSRGQEIEQEPRLLRRETVATSNPTARVAETSADNRVISGISNQALIGTILGAAAGAALAYTMVKSEEPRPNEVTRPRMVTYHSSPAVTSPRIQEVETVIEAMSIRSDSHVGSRSKTGEPPVVKQDDVNGKVALEEIDEEKSVTHVSRRSHGSHRSQEKGSPQVKDNESRKSSSEISKSSRHSSKSKKPKDQPEAPDPPESASGRSQKKYNDDSKSRASRSESRHTSSYVSARSEASTVKPKDKEKARSKVTTTLTVSNKEALDRASQKGSLISARNVPLPESTHVTRTSHREHRDRDRDSGISGISARDIPLPESTYTIMSARNYPLPESTYTGPAYSVAPSDSISSIGLKRERQRRRM